MTAKADFRNNVIRKIESALRSGQIVAIAEIGADLMEGTPIDKHDMINAWNFSNDGSTEEFHESKDADSTNAMFNYGARSEYRMEKYLKSFRVKDKVTYIVNNAPYAITIEKGGYRPKFTSEKVTPDGFSTQAPRGVIEPNVEKFLKVLKDSVQNQLDYVAR